MSACGVVLVAPDVAGSASALTGTPRLALRDGRLLVVEVGADGRDALAQAVTLVVPVPALGLALVQSEAELFLLPLAALAIGDGTDGTACTGRAVEVRR